MAAAQGRSTSSCSSCSTLTRRSRLRVAAGVAAGVAVGDKVMQIASDDEAEVCKGDVGTMKTIDTDASELTGY